MVNEVDPKRGEVFKPCVFNPKEGADKEMCQRLSSIPTRAVQCEAAQCKCQWRVKDTRADKPKPEHSIAAVLEGLKNAQTVRGSGLSQVKHESVFPLKPTPVLVMPEVNLPKAEPKAPRVPIMVAQSPPPQDDAQDSGEWKQILERVKIAMANGVLITVDPKCLRPMGGQPREYFSESSLENIRQSIREVGQIQPGIIRVLGESADGVTHEILDGERRWRVMSEANLPYRAMLVEIDDDAAPYMIAAIANFNREGHTPMEISDAIHKMRSGKMKMPLAEIAKIFGFSEIWASQMHGLQNLHPDVRAMLDPNLPREKALVTTAAIHISKLHVDLQFQMASRVLSKEVTLARLRQAVIKEGEAHGKPVRTHELRPDKVQNSFANRCAESARLARDVLDKVLEMQTRGIMPSAASERTKLLVTSLDAAIRDFSAVRDALKR